MTTGEASLVSIVLPTYGNVAGIQETVAQLKAFLDRTPEKRFEVVFVDDMSPDGTWPVLLAAIGGDSRFRAVRLAKNSGQHRATRIGLGLARGSLVVTMDDDLQHPVEEIPKLLAVMRDDLDVVYGCYRQRNHGAWRRFASWAADVTLRATFGLMRRERWQRPTSFRVLSRRILGRLARAKTQSFMFDGWIHAHTARIEYVLVRHEPRKVGRSSYTLRKLVQLYLNLVLGYSAKPLNVVWTLGLVFSFVGIVLSVAIIGLALTRGGIDTGTAIVAGVTLLSGVQLMATGVIGQYVGRTFLQQSLLDDDGDLIVERADPKAP